jgi:DNA-directed RNA polymerase specialized sigma24 family protein
MNKEWVLTQENFNQLLNWLAPSREQAGKKYEEIRRRLITIFTCRGCREAEELADETINRVTRRVPDIAGTYTGDQALYFYGVAHKVHLEYLRKKPAPPPPPPIEKSEEEEDRYDCLERCMMSLTPENRELLLNYYQEEKRAKIDARKKFAERLNMPLNALRIRVFRIRETLRACVLECLEKRVAG